MAQRRANAPTRMRTRTHTRRNIISRCCCTTRVFPISVAAFGNQPFFSPLGRWLAKCSATVATMDPKIAAGSLVLAGANFEGLTAAWPRVLLQELSEHFGLSRNVLIEGMATLCNSYGQD